MEVVAVPQETTPIPSATSRVSVGGAGGRVVETQAAMAPAAAPSDKVTKVIVAVHGVGDQHQYATIQSVVGQFCRYYSAPTATPLGSFHNRRQTYAFAPPLPAPELESLAFAEVYWATIPRQVVTDKHTLEEARKWAHTIVERLRLRWHQGLKDPACQAAASTCKDGDFRLLKQVLTEMIETVTVLERLCYLGDRAGLFTFDLRRLLDDYLGDVQVVAEFGDSRTKILEAFAKVMDQAHQEYPNAELHIVAHSEGTVVAFLGLLQAWRSTPVPQWARQVRGLMTLGSPIDKHLMLWPELFGSADPAELPAADARIEWRNYYDRGDPIGFELDDARRWLDAGPWQQVFHFQPAHDFGFIRYPFPGKAHVDYWDDDAVFRHFIGTVVRPNTEAEADAGPPPGDDRFNKWSSYVLPYVGLALLLFLAVYFPFKAIAGYVGADAAGGLRGVGAVARDVAGVAVFLLGITVAARIPRLTHTRRWRLRAWAIYAACLAVGWWLLVAPAAGQEAGSGFNLGRGSAAVLGVTSFVLVLASRGLGAAKPSWGLKPLIALGTTMLLGAAAYLLSNGNASPPPDGKLWPVFLAVGGFAYLWWLAALFFDLVFVWHVHIRQSTAMQRLRHILPPPAPKAAAGA